MGVQTDRADLADRICAAEAEARRVRNRYFDALVEQSHARGRVNAAKREYDAARAVLRRLQEEEGA
jgi:hypothetical protein